MNTIEFCSIAIDAQHIADSAHVAYWLASADQDIRYHVTEIRRNFEKLSALITLMDQPDPRGWFAAGWKRRYEYDYDQKAYYRYALALDRCKPESERILAK